MKSLLLIPAVWIIACLPAQAGLIIAGNHTLQANTPNQIIDILVGISSPGEIAPGLNLNVVLGDGGSIIGGSDVGSPVITGINLKPAGGLFSNLPNAQTDILTSPKLLQSSIVALTIPSRPTITGTGLLAQLTIDTTGIQSGSWVLDLDGIDSIGLPTSDFAGLPTTVTNGFISIASVPEPTTLWVLGLALAMSPRLKRRGTP